MVTTIIKLQRVLWSILSQLKKLQKNRKTNGSRVTCWQFYREIHSEVIGSILIRFFSLTFLELLKSSGLDLCEIFKNRVYKQTHAF